MSKYSILDDESNLNIGTCDNISGLMGELLDDNENYHKIILENFRIAQSFKNQSYKTKSSVVNIHLCIMDHAENLIGSYYFSINTPWDIYKSNNVNEVNFELFGTLLSKASKEALEIWESWRLSTPNSLNLWADYSEKQRNGWLEVARLYSTKGYQEDQRNGEFTLDAAYVTDPTSFFCALGEAIRGPGGYYGFNFMSLEDCLCGDFGAIPPFTIKLKNTKGIWSKNNFIEQIIEMFSDYQVKVLK